MVVIIWLWWWWWWQQWWWWWWQRWWQLKPEKASHYQETQGWPGRVGPSQSDRRACACFWFKSWSLMIIRMMVEMIMIRKLISKAVSIVNHNSNYEKLWCLADFFLLTKNIMTVKMIMTVVKISNVKCFCLFKSWPRAEASMVRQALGRITSEVKISEKVLPPKKAWKFFSQR